MYANVKRKCWLGRCVFKGDDEPDGGKNKQGGWQDVPAQERGVEFVRVRDICEKVENKKGRRVQGTLK